MDPRTAIPHRPPFLLLDDIVELDAASVTATRRLDPADELLGRVYAGHYPGCPITPGVLLCEMVFQAGAVLMHHRLVEAAPEKVPLLAKIQSARFKRMVRPGETVTVRASFVEQIGRAYRLRGTVHVENELAVRTEFLVTPGDPHA